MIPVIITAMLLGTGAGAQLASIEEKFRQAVIRSTALAGVAAVLLAVGLGAALCRSFTVNLRRLSEAAAEYGKGGLEHRVTVSSRDEVGALAESFNTMAGNLGRMDNARKSLVADVAHELRTPLFILGGNLESIQAGVTEPTPEVVAALQDEVLRMSRLVSDLQNLSLAEAGKLPLHVTEVAPTELLTAVEAAVAPEAENNGVKLSVCATDAFPKVALDRDRITQVLLNLIGNAFKFTPAGGLITLSAKINGNRVVFTVADTGPGIPSEHIPFVFDRFYRAEQSRSRAEGGMGLGLAIAKGYVEAHGGQIWVDSVPAKGTTFSFSLPLTDISKTPNRTNDYGNNLPPSRV
jgi:signal transduction histidine kinase